MFAHTGAFAKDALRTVRANLGRFLAIVGITALGCGFYAGLRMCGPDMRAAADAWYDGSRVWDLRLVSTLGWGDDDMVRIGRIDGVEAVMPTTSVDAMARLGSEQVAVRIATLNIVAARNATVTSATTIESDDAAYLNRVRLVAGRWPASGSECVVCADATLPGFGVGSTVEVLSTTANAEGWLATYSFDVVGVVTAANYPYTANFGSTTLGSGMVEQYVYVAPDAMTSDATYTDAYVRLGAAAAYESEGDAYLAAVGMVADKIEARATTLMGLRLADVRSTAQVELDKRTAELAAARADATAQVDAGAARLATAAAELADAERSLAAGEAAYADGMASYLHERDAAEARLDAAEAELAAGQAEHDAGAARLDSAATELATGEAELASRTDEFLSSLSAQGLPAASLDEADASLAATRAELASSIAQLDAASDGIIQLQAAKAELAAAEEQAGELSGIYERLAGELVAQGYARADVDEAVARVQEHLADFEVWAREHGVAQDVADRIVALAGQAQELLGQMRQLSDGKAELSRQEAALLFSLSAQGLPAGSLDEAHTSVSAERAEAEATLASLAEAADGLARLRAAKAELASARTELSAGRTELDSARSRLESGRAELSAGRTEATRQLAAAKAQLDEGAATLAASRAQLADGRVSYERGRTELENARVRADAQLADADAQLADAQARLDALEPGELYVLDRTRSEGAATYHADTERMDAIAAVFPFIFFLVAALVALTTMTRMVEDERVQIGTYKALGYGTAAIAARYLGYAAAASLAGATLGIAVLSQVLPAIVTSAYDIIYAVPPLPFPLPVSLPVVLASGGLGVGVTLLATWAAVVASLRETPATLLLPRAPAAGRRILLERVSAVWRRLSFSWKVTCRNIFRYRRRLLMTVVGISGCTALLLVGFGLHDAIWDIIDCQYGPIIHHDTTVGLDEDATTADVDTVADYLAGTGEVVGIIRVHGKNMQVRGTDTGDATMRAQVVVPESSASLAEAVTLRERVGHVPVAFDDDAVVITEKLALRYSIGVGDDIVLFEQDATGTATGAGHALSVTGIAENYVGNLVYVGGDAWVRVAGVTPVFDTLYARTTPDAAVRADIAEYLHDLAHVSTVTFSDETINLYRTMLSVVDMIVVVLIVSAAALAFIVLYNLTNINVAERVREIASLKVLGFTRREVYAYIFREMILLAVLGAFLGMALGTWLATFVITTAEVDYVMFGRTIHAASYVYAFVLTIAFAVGIACAMRGRLDRIDMVESLKSVE